MLGRPPVDPTIRFWRMVQKYSDCWLWRGSIIRGYGQFTVKAGKVVKAHRFAFEEAYGPIPDGLIVCHSCDYRICVRPDHLILGTYDDNNLDMYLKGRGANGAGPCTSIRAKLLLLQNPSYSFTGLPREIK